MLSTVLKRSIEIVRPVSRRFLNNQPSVVFSRGIMWNSNAADNTYDICLYVDGRVDITFCFANGKQQKVKARLGDSLKDTADAFHLPVPGSFPSTFIMRRL